MVTFFVHGNYHDTGLLNMSLGNTKVYGSMNDERSAETETDRIVSDCWVSVKACWLPQAALHWRTLP